MGRPTAEQVRAWYERIAAAFRRERDVARAAKMQVEIDAKVNPKLGKLTLEKIVAAVIERLREELPAELRQMCRDVESDPFDQLALAAVADYCDERGLPRTAEAFRRLRFQSGDVLVVKAQAHLSQEAIVRLKRAMEESVVDWLRKQGIEVAVLVLPAEIDLQLLRISKDKESKDA